MSRRVRFAMTGGTFDLLMEREDLPVESLCGFALRHNAKRRFLFVSRVLGRHLPVSPARLREVAGLLADRISAAPDSGPVLFFGMAETATTLGQAVFRAWRERGGPDALYLDTTRRRTGGPVAFEFSEDHSHATAHLVHRPGAAEDPDNIFERARRVVVIDDEATTARTAAHLIRALAAFRGSEAAEAELAVLLHWQPADGGGIAAFRAIRSLASGSFTFTPGDPLPEAPAAVLTADDALPAPRGTRHGIRRAQDWNGPLPVLSGERILVLGTGEYGFRPLRLAEAFEARGAVTAVQATTRSPILAGGAIDHVRAFPSLTGEARTEFLYNVPDTHDWDHVLLCPEGHDLRPDHPLRAVPRLEVIHSPS